VPAKNILKYLPAAQEDLLSILDYIAQDSPQRALAFVDKLDVYIGRL
jgi:Plasmid stabilisation system protein.